MRADGQKPNRRRERRASGQVIAKPISIKGAERRFGGGAREGGRNYLGRSAGGREFATEGTQDVLTHPQKSAEGLVAAQAAKARTAPARG